MSGPSARKNAGMIDERRSRVASYKVRGFSIRQTVAALERDGLQNPATKRPWSFKAVADDLLILTAHWKAEAARDAFSWNEQELAEIDETEREAWAAWHRGIGKRQITFTERRDPGIKVVKDGEKPPAGGSKASVRTEDLNGDPRFLAVILDCQDRRAKLLGLDAPTRNEHSGPGGAPIPHRIEVVFVDAKPNGDQG